MYIHYVALLYTEDVLNNDAEPQHTLDNSSTINKEDFRCTDQDVYKLNGVYVSCECIS